MGDTDHDEVVRRSFARQVSLFSGPDSPFAHHPGAHDAAAHRAASPLAWIEPLAPDMIVLDVACGAAHASDPIAPQVRQVVGIDLTRELLEVGAQRLRDAGIHNVLLQEANAQRLPFLDESFDVVFCRGSLHHFADAPKAVGEMVRVSRTGGRVVLADLVAPDADSRDLFDEVHRLLDPSHVRTFLESELAELLPGGIDSVTYADTSTIRLPIDVAFTDQSHRDRVLELLTADISGHGSSTGLEPTREDGRIVVSFRTRVVHGRVSGVP